MKTAPFTLLLPMLCGMFAVSASAATTIINSSTRNGSFESGTGSGAGSTITDWEAPLASTQEQRTDNAALASLGTYSATIGSTSDLNARTGAALNTGYTVVLGDTFDLSFDWLAAGNWDAGDKINYRLFTTAGDVIGGAATLIGSGSVTGFAQGAAYQSESLTSFGTVVGASDGRDLWVEFISEHDGFGIHTGEFARLDNVQLSVVPEPSATALLGLGGLALILRRRHC